MKVKINAEAYKPILSTSWTKASVDHATLAWIVNKALASAGAPPLFDIDDAGDDALVILAPVPDGYGGKDAIDILYPDDVDMKFVEYHDLGDVYAVHRRGDGRLLGYVTTYYGSNGKGRLAAQDFDPAPGVTVRFD